MSRRKKSRLVQLVEYGFYRAISAFVHASGEERVYRWGGMFGALCGKVLRGRDRLAMRNLRATFPEQNDKELRATLNECWRHFGRQMLLYVWLQRVSVEEAMARCEVVNRHLIDEAFSRGNGIVVLSAHFGSWEFGGLAVTSIAQNVHTVVRRLDNEYLERDLANLRKSTGVQLIDRRNAARAVMKALADNALVVMVPDQAVLPAKASSSPSSAVRRGRRPHRPGWPKSEVLRLCSLFAFRKKRGIVSSSSNRFVSIN